MPSILCVGGDVELLETRAAVLRETGAEVQCAQSREAMATIESGRFDLVVLCHSVRQDEAKQLFEAAHRRLASSQVLRLARNFDWPGENVSADRVAKTDPVSIVQAATELLRQPSGAGISGGQGLRA